MNLRSIIEFEKPSDTVQICHIPSASHSEIRYSWALNKPTRSANPDKIIGGLGWEDDERQEKERYVSSPRLPSVFPSESQKPNTRAVLFVYDQIAIS